DGRRDGVMTEGPRLFSAKMAGRERQRASCDRGESETRAQCIHDPRIAELLREPRLIERADDDGGKGEAEGGVRDAQLPMSQLERRAQRRTRSQDLQRRSRS